MRALRTALNWARKQSWIDSVPDIDRIKVEDSDHMRGRPLFGEEFERLLAVVPEIVGDGATNSWRYVLRGVVASGLRLAELMSISWDIPQTIQPTWARGREPVLAFPAQMQKNKRKQQIPLCPWFEELLLETPEELRTGWVFEPESLQHKNGRRYRGERLTPENVGRVISRIGRRSGIIVDEGNARTGAPEKCCTVHDLRRTYAQRLANPRPFASIRSSTATQLTRSTSPTTVTTLWLMAPRA